MSEEWELDARNIIIREAGTRESVARLSTGTLDGAFSDEKIMDRAHKIKAAPLMYESLQDLIIAMEDAGLGHIDDVEKARTVSQKARGEQT